MPTVLVASDERLCWRCEGRYLVGVVAMKELRWLILVVLLLGNLGVSAQEEVPVFTLKSEAFSQEGEIPLKYTCLGENLSPPLCWENLPQGARSLVLICEDPDAPRGIFTHWILYNIPPSLFALSEGVGKKGEAKIMDNIFQGKNDFGKLGYGGPCPPPGKPHRYFFRLIAVDLELPPKAGLTRKQVLELIEGHILEEAQLMGVFGR